MVVLGGDFRKILPVIRKGCRHDIVLAAINSSTLWKSYKVLNLSTNMSLFSAASKDDGNAIKDFSDWILQIREGKKDCIENGETDIDIPHDPLIKDTENPFHKLPRVKSYPHKGHSCLSRSPVPRQTKPFFPQISLHRRHLGRK